MGEFDRLAEGDAGAAVVAGTVDQFMSSRRRSAAICGQGRTGISGSTPSAQYSSAASMASSAAFVAASPESRETQGCSVNSAGCTRSALAMASSVLRLVTGFSLRSTWAQNEKDNPAKPAASRRFSPRQQRTSRNRRPNALPSSMSLSATARGPRAGEHICTHVHTSLGSPGRRDPHPPGQATQLGAAGVATGPAQQASDGFADEHVMVDALRGELFGVHQHADGLVPGRVLRREGAADLSPELGLAHGGGQQLGVHRLGRFRALPYSPISTASAVRQIPTLVDPNHNCAQLPTSVSIRAANAEASSRWVAATSGSPRTPAASAADRCSIPHACTASLEFSRPVWPSAAVTERWYCVARSNRPVALPRNQTEYPSHTGSSRASAHPRTARAARIGNPRSPSRWADHNAEAYAIISASSTPRRCAGNLT